MRRLTRFLVTAGTVFHDSRLPLTLWFRAAWWVASQKNGVSVMACSTSLGLKSYKTSWTLLHKLRRAMVRPGRDRLRGHMEVDEAFVGGEEERVCGLASTVRLCSIPLSLIVHIG